MPLGRVHQYESESLLAVQVGLNNRLEVLGGERALRERPVFDSLKGEEHNNAIASRTLLLVSGRVEVTNYASDSNLTVIGRPMPYRHLVHEDVVVDTQPVKFGCLVNLCRIGLHALH